MALSSSRGTRKVSSKQRLSDDILLAFHVACEDWAIEIAQRLFDQLEVLARRPDARSNSLERRKSQNLAAPRERLRNLMVWEGPSAACGRSNSDEEATENTGADRTNFES
jgi:hypothetical protein